MIKVLLTRYVLPILSVGIALSVKLLFDPEIGHEAPFLLFLTPVMVSAWFGGFRAGLLATLLSTFAIGWFFMKHDPSITEFERYLRLGIFGFEACFIGWLGHVRWKKVQAEKKLREQEALLHLAHDAIIVRDQEDRIIFWNKGAEEIYGWPSQTVLGKEAHHLFKTQFPQPLEEIDAVLQQKGRWEGQLIHFRRDGERVAVESRWAAKRDRKGKIVGVLQINRDITQRDQVERSLTIQYAVARILADSETINEAAQKIIQKICEVLGWRVGALWLIDSKDNVLKCIELWHDPSIKIDEFKKVSLETNFPLGKGLPGRVWSEGQPAWIPDVTEDSNFPRAPFALKEGLHAACGFPLKLGDQILGVIEFFSKEVLVPNPALLNIIGIAGNQIGQLIERMQAEEDLRRSQSELSDFVENSTIGIHWVGPDGKILWANQNELNLLGYSREEYVGHSISEFHVDKKNIETILHRLLNKEVLSNYEATLFCKDGSTKHVMINSNVLRRSNGDFIHTRCFTRDITELKRAEEALKQSEARYTDLYENAPDMYVSISAKTAKILTCNKTLSKVLGYRKEEIIGRPVFDLYHPDYLEEARKSFQMLIQTGAIHDVELQLIRKGGFPIDVSLNASAVRDREGNILYSRSSWRDITERKKMEKQLQESTKVKTEFTSMVSHELRTPLQVIKGGVDIVLNGTLGTVKAEQREQLEAVKRNVDRLTRLIHDVLDYQKLDSGVMEFRMRPIDMNDLIRDTADLFTPLAKEKGLDLACNLNSELSNVVCDKDKIAQVLVNFIDNAVKFTKRGSVIVKSEKQEDSVLISVCDEGIGIKKEDQVKIFENFTQLSTRSKKEGTGLGLAICKKIVEGHGGEIGVDSEHGRGSIFYFKLPNGRNS